MRKIGTLLVVLSLLGGKSVAQNAKAKSNNEAELKEVLSSFMNCIVKKDSVKFYDLFYNGPVTWVGVFKEKSQKEKDNNIFIGNHKGFYRNVSNKDFDEEKFYNVSISEDGYVASVTFDYCFWSLHQKQNWGKESWGLVKANGKWKISSVIFSMEYEKNVPEPKR